MLPEVILHPIFIFGGRGKLRLPLTVRIDRVVDLLEINIRGTLVVHVENLRSSLPVTLIIISCNLLIDNIPLLVPDLHPPKGNTLPNLLLILYSFFP